jgi:Domain of unknown function (DUF3850)
MKQPPEQDRCFRCGIRKAMLRGLETPCESPNTFSHTFTDPFWAKPLLWGKHCRGLGCDDFNEQHPACICPCSACSKKAAPMPGADDLKMVGQAPHREPGVPVLHELKTWPNPFEAIEAGTKHHEIRTNDRHFVQGDRLRLREWDPSTEKYTGRERTVGVSYASYGGAWGLPDDLCVMSIEREAAPDRSEADG